MSTPQHYKATLDPETGRWFFTTPTGRSSGWKFEKPCQHVADTCKDDAAAEAGKEEVPS